MTLDVSLNENYKGVWGNRIGIGNKTALILVDFMKAYITEGEPLYAPMVISAVKHAQEVLNICREKGILIIHTHICYQMHNQIDGGIWVKKSPVMRAMVQGNEMAEFCKEVQPKEDEVVITKQYASSFFGTSLSSLLSSENIDTLVIMGCSTSGCIRATAVDAVQNGFRTIVLRECVGDRHIDPHKANLFDIDSKYGDVISKDDYLKHLHAQ